jgi:hypothetical protein
MSIRNNTDDGPDSKKVCPGAPSRPQPPVESVDELVCPGAPSRPQPPIESVDDELVCPGAPSRPQPPIESDDDMDYPSMTLDFVFPFALPVCPPAPRKPRPVRRIIPDNPNSPARVCLVKRFEESTKSAKL